MIKCNEINQVANEVLATLRKCKPVTNENVIQLTELIIAINNCNEGGGGLNALIPNWEDRLYIQGLLVFHNNSIWRNDCEEVTGEPGVDECWTLISEINEDILWEDIKGDQSSVNLSGFNNDLDINDELENDIFSDVTAGAINAGETVPEGTTFTEFVELLLSKTFYPTFTNWSISGNAGSAVEVGTSTKTISITFNRGNIVGDIDSGVWNPSLVQGQRLGVANKYWINSIDNGTSNSLNISELTTLGSNSVPIAVDYDAGDQPKDSKGNNYLTPEPSGTLNGTATWTGFYYRTAIAGNSAPTASDIRNNYTARRSTAGVINLPSGTTNVRFDVFVPQGASLTSAIDEGNLNLDITSEFVLQSSDFSGLDANGDEVLYNHYVRIIDNPYGTSSNLAITVT